MRVVATVLNWNGGDENLRCIRALLAEGLAPADIVFVDNGSTRGTWPELRRTFPDLTFVENERNAGYALGSNQGLRIGMERGADLLFLVNNDVEIPPGTLARLTAALDADPTLGAVGPRVLYADDPSRVWCAGGSIDYLRNITTLHGHRAPDGPRWQVTRRVDFVPGCALLVRREVLEEVGLFDEDFFAYHEDADLCLRINEAGHGVALIGDAHALHSPHSTTGGGYNPRRKYMMAVNSVWFLRKHGTPARWLRFFVLDVATLPLLLLVSPLLGGRARFRGALAKCRGTRDGLRGVRITAELVDSLPT
ncbi:MAG TPA: glycosyltransferase family 2 protein [Planctomycetes bacterium]|nr:glycosyltransferase family 2 protein [Planctomycetota bacterium]